MPVTASAKKKLRVDNRRKLINQRVKRQIRAVLKTFRLSPSIETLKKVHSTLDKAAKKGVIPKKRADRKKGRLAFLLAKKLPKVASQKKKRPASRRNQK